MEQKLIAVVAGALRVPTAVLKLDTAPGDVEAWDSLGHINIVSEIEAEFRVSIPIDKIADIRRVRDFLPYIARES